MINQRNYLRCDEIKNIKLEQIYSNNDIAIKDLDYNLESIISTEAPICLDLLKERLREAFNIGKISQKALDIIMLRIKKLGIVITKDLFDIVLWPSEGAYPVKFVRLNSDRTIYQVPEVEMKLVYNHFKEISKDEEELYHKILNFFGFQTLTKKALEYFNHVKYINA